MYKTSSTSVIQTLINRPSFGEGEMAMIVIALGAPSYLMQIYFAKNGMTSAIFNRVYSNGQWSEWNKL